MGQNCSELILKCFGLSTWADSETNLFNSTSSFGKWDRCWVNYIHHSSSSLGSSMGSRNVQQSQHSLRRVLWPGTHRQCKRFPAKWELLHKSEWLHLEFPTYLGNPRKGTKERCRWDVQIRKTVNLALDTQETQTCCLHKTMTPKWWRLATRHNQTLPLLSPAVLWQPLCRWTPEGDLPGGRFALL